MALPEEHFVTTGVSPRETDMQAFSFATTAQILCEVGLAIRLAELCRERRARRVLIVTDLGSPGSAC